MSAVLILRLFNTLSYYKRKPAKIARIFRFLVILLAALCWHALRSISGCIIAYIDYPWFLVQTLLERYKAVL